MTVLSHAMLFIASFFATPTDIGHAHMQDCQNIAHAAQAAPEQVWLPASFEVRVRAYGAMRTREAASVRVMGRCVVKNAPEDAQPVLYVPFGSQLGNSDDEDVADIRASTKPQFGRPVARGLGPAALHAPSASVAQLERPPRV